MHYEAQRAFEQYNQVDPANRLVAEVLEQRWNAKLETLERLQGELDTYSDAAASLTPTETETILALGHDFAVVWDDPVCPMVLKKKIVRTLINEIVVDLDTAAQALQMIIHWNGGCHTALACQNHNLALWRTRPHWKTSS